MEDVREKIEKWGQDYNGFRPHSSLGDLTTRQFADKYKARMGGGPENFSFYSISYQERPIDKNFIKRAGSL